MREGTTRGEPFLTDEMGGRHLVETEDGTNLRLDLDGRTVETFAASPTTPFMRRDREAVDLVLLATCRVGEPMVLLLDLEIPGVWFTRRTTEPVTGIRAEAASAAELQFDELERRFTRWA